MSNTVLADSLTKCRMESIFGDGSYFGCFTISNLIIATGMVTLIILILFIIMFIRIRREKDD